MGSVNTVRTYFAAAASNPADTIGAGRICKLNTGTGKVERTSDEDTELPLGVAKGCDDEDGGAVSVCIAGTNDVEFGGVVNPGGLVMTDADGKAIAAVAPCYVVGRYLGTSATAAGQIAQIEISPYRLVVEA